MKKLLVVFFALALVMAFTAPTWAVDWNFYGNARMATFWDDRDFGDSKLATGDNSDTDLIWDFQGNSRVGAKIKLENISAQFEFGVNESSITSRRLYGKWKFSDNATLKIGKDYTPISQFISGQVFDGDLGLLGIGTAYGSRHGQLGLDFGLGQGQLSIALITPSSGSITSLVTGTFVGDIDAKLPKIEASYAMSLDTFNFKVMGGYQTFQIENATAGGKKKKDVDVDSWIIGLDAGANFGAIYVKGAVSYGTNVSNAGWNIPGFKTDGAGAAYSGKSSTKDTDTLMYALVAGFKATDTLSFEAGYGYRKDDSDVSGAEDDEAWGLYGQAVVQLAPGVFLVPEIGYYDYKDGVTGADQGDEWYAGAKWQINF